MLEVWQEFKTESELRLHLLLQNLHHNTNSGSVDDCFTTLPPKIQDDFQSLAKLCKDHILSKSNTPDVFEGTKYRDRKSGEECWEWDSEDQNETPRLSMTLLKKISKQFIFFKINADVVPIHSRVYKIC